MGRRRNWKWFSGIAAVIGCISSCTTEDASKDDNAANACTLIEADGGSVLHCGVGPNIPLDGTGSFLANSTREEEGNNCENGGTRLEIGRDYNEDGVLDPKEVDSVQYVCSNASGSSAGHVLIAVTDEAAGENCSNGGQRIESGLDDNGNDVLDPEEVDSQHYVCSGTNGTNGTNGSTGATGDAGTDGTASLINVTPIQGGNNSPCPDGGQQVEYGLDDDRDGVLDSEEIDGTRYVCSGAQGSQGPIGDAGADGLNTVLLVSIEDPGENCEWGGQRFEWGLDDDRDGVLDVPQWVPASSLLDGGDGGDAGTVAVGDDEVDGVEYVCSGAPGLNSLTVVTPEPQYIWYWNETCGTNWYWVWQGCWEGTYTDAGADAGSTYNPYCNTVWLWDYYGCNDSYYGGCFPTAGQRIETGLDDNRDGQLQSEEVESTEYVCDGMQSLVEVTPEPAQTQVYDGYYGCWQWNDCWNTVYGACYPNDGQQIDTGLDLNGDGNLDPNEVYGTEYVCDGNNNAVQVPE